MKAWSVGLLLPAVLMLAGCQTDRPADEPAFTEERAPEVEGPAPAAERVPLESVGEAQIAGEIEAWPEGDQTRIVVRVNNALPNETYGARVQSGTCESPGPELGRLSAISTDATGQGQSESTVSHAPHLIMDSNHIAAVYAPGTEPERDMPVACAQLPATSTGAGMPRT